MIEYTDGCRQPHRVAADDDQLEGVGLPRPAPHAAEPHVPNRTLGLILGLHEQERRPCAPTANGYPLRFAGFSDVFSTRRASRLSESAWYSFANCTGSRSEIRFSLFSVRSWIFT